MASIRFRIAPHIGALAVAALLLLTGALGRAAAETPDTITTQLKPGINFVGWVGPETPGETPDTITTQLKPGINFVGWVGPETPVADLFDDVPEIEAVYTWDATAKHWAMAAPNVPMNLNSLRTLAPGMGLVVRLGGAQPVEWSRRYSRASGFIWLAPGLNLVAWTGDRGKAIHNAANNLGTSFSAAHVWDAAEDRYLPYNPEQRDDASVPIAQGDALWIDAREGQPNRWQHWLQRDDALEVISGLVTGVNEKALTGIEVNASTMDTGGGWFFSTTGSDGAFYITARADLAYQLWLRHPDGCELYYYQDVGRNTPKRSLLIHTAQPTQALRFRTVEHPCTSEVRGRLTRVDGAPLVGADLILLRHDSRDTFGVNRVKADGSFRVSVREDDLYHFGFSLHEDCLLFYDQGDFNSERGSVAPFEITGASAPEIMITLPDGVCGWEIEGRVVASDGTPLSGVRVSVSSLDDTHLTQRRTTSDGSFVATVPAHNTYRLSAVPNADCVQWHRDGGAVGEQADASLIEVAEQDVAGVLFEVSEHACGTQVSGRLVGPQGEPFGGVQIDVFEHDDDTHRIINRTNNDGSFKIFIRDGEIIRLWLNNLCLGYYDGDDVSPFRDAAVPVRINDIDVTAFTLRVPSDVCAWQISGNVLGPDGEPITDGGIGLIDSGSKERGAGFYPLEPDGSFAITVPVPDDYRLHVRINYCSLYFDGETVSTHLPASGHISVRGAHLDGIDVRIPPGICTSWVRGFIVDAGGASLGDVYVVAQNYDGMAAAYTETDGSFEIMVPADGEYVVLVYADDNCWLYHSERGATVRSEEAAAIQVGDGYDDVLRVRIPDNPCG